MWDAAEVDGAIVESNRGTRRALGPWGWTKVLAMNYVRGGIGEAIGGAAESGAGATFLLHNARHQLTFVPSGGAGRIEAFVDEVSAPLPGRHLATDTDALTLVPVHMRARLASSAGPVPEAVAASRAADQACEWLVRPVSQGGRVSCRATLRCGANLVYGAGETGYSDCVFVPGITHFEDSRVTLDDGDPRVEYASAGKTLLVEDTEQGEPWSARFELDAHPRCAAGGLWRGAARITQQRSAEVELSFEAGGANTRLQVSFDDRTVTIQSDDVELNCDAGTLIIRASAPLAAEARTATPIHMRFGPGFASLAGSLGDLGTFVLLPDLGQ